jgi:hypothetical protein
MEPAVFATVAAVIAGLVGVPAVNFLKGKLGWSGERVKFLSAVTSGVLSFLALGAACVIAIAGLACVLPLTWDTGAAAVGIAFTVSQLFYALLPKA